MRALHRWLISCVLLAAMATPALAGGNANFILGGRGLDEDFWEPIDGQFATGVTVDFGKEGWPIHLESGIMLSVGHEDDFFFGDISGGVSELFFGVNKTWEHGSVRPFIGGGLSAIGAAVELDGPVNTIDDDDGSGGLYAHGGVYWRLGSRFNIGIDARILVGTDVTLFGEEGDADYAQLGMILGWGWPAAPAP